MAMSLRVERNTKTLRELTVEKLRDAILSRHFAPGERLVERSLCDELGVSRTVVREAIRQLETEGLVETVAHQGPSVARLDPDTAAQIYEVRAELEGLACRAAADSASDDDIAQLDAALGAIADTFALGRTPQIIAATTRFYEIVFRIGGKSVAWGIVQTLNARISQLRSVTLGSPNRERDSLAEMREIFDAVAGRDPARAERACMDHVHAAAAVARERFSRGGRGQG